MKIQTAEKVLAKHTPGPWTVAFSGVANDDNTSLVSMITVPTGRRSVAVVAEVHDLNRGTQSAPQFTAGEREANAALIKAAPDLLAALKLAREALAEIEEREDDVFVGMDEIDAAIAKAEGRE